MLHEIAHAKGLEDAPVFEEDLIGSQVGPVKRPSSAYSVGRLADLLSRDILLHKEDKK